MAKRFAVVFAFCLFLVACCGAVRLPPQITNSMGWTHGSRVVFHGDVDFTTTERSAIAMACAHWTHFTEGGMHCTVNFDRDFTVTPYTGEPDDYAIIRTNAKELTAIIFMDGDRRVNPANILGYAPHDWNLITGNRTGVIFLAMDNIAPEPWEAEHELYRITNLVAKHEMGHVFGFIHVDDYHERPNVMHAGIKRPEDLNALRRGGFGDDDYTQCLRLGLCR